MVCQRTRDQITSDNLQHALSGINSMSELFKGSADFNSDIKHWDVKYELVISTICLMEQHHSIKT